MERLVLPGVAKEGFKEEEGRVRLNQTKKKVRLNQTEKVKK